MRIFFLILFFLIAVSVQSQISHPDPGYGNHPKGHPVVERDALISFAKKYLGTPYHYASSNPKNGFDCSGFVNFVFSNFSIKLPRSSGEFKSIGTDLKPEEFKIGDILIFYGFRNKTRIGHVGIVCEANGMNSKFIHSSSGKIKGIVISELGSGMYARRFFRCIDVIGKK
jgi:cell wall-associated NlpC family hydrolase